MFDINSIANKFRLAYLIFTLLLCATFVGIFYIAETKIEQAVIQSHLLQQLPLSLEKEGEKPIYHPNSAINIYQFESAPQALKETATAVLKDTEVEVNNSEAELHYFKTHYQGQNYILSYVENATLDGSDYPLLSVFEDLESIIYQALIGAILLSVLIALLFSYLSSKAIIQPILDLKEAVESDHSNLDELTHLPSQVGVLARAIDEKNSKLAEYLKREQLFTGDVSHELRTPLTIIMGAAEVISGQLEPNSPSTVFAERIYKTALDTSEVVSALLLLSRKPEQLDSPVTCINTVVTELVARLGYLLYQKPALCRVSAIGNQQYSANVRPELLKMALGNLIKNAFQYTQEGQIDIVIDDKRISISDTGLGVPDSMLPLMYERFQSSEHHNSHAEGVGLGLSIVQRIMTHLGWRLTYVSNANGGSTFSIYYR